MITLRRAEDRQHERRGKRELWRTFYPGDPTLALADGFGALELLDEHALPPGASVPYFPSHDAEIITYVHEGGLAFDDSTGRSGVIQAGEFQRMNVARGFRHSKTNASRSHWTRLFKLRLRRPSTGPERRYEQKRFSTAERRGGFCVVASPDARRGSLVTHDVFVYSALLGPGKHVVHDLSQGRSAWLHVVKGEVTLGDVVLTSGDGAGVTTERAVSLTAREESELLLCELGELPPGLLEPSGGKKSSRG